MKFLARHQDNIVLVAVVAAAAIGCMIRYAELNPIFG